MSAAVRNANAPPSPPPIASTSFPSTSPPTPSECSDLINQADPGEIEKLWQAVYEHKEKMEEGAAAIVTAESSSPSTISGRIAITDNEDWWVTGEHYISIHFGMRTVADAGVDPVVTDQDATDMFRMWANLEADGTRRTLAELVDVVQTYLAPRRVYRRLLPEEPQIGKGDTASSSPSPSHAPSSQTPSRWVRHRILQANVIPTYGNNLNRWQQIKPRAPRPEKRRAQQANHAHAVASITFWLARQPAIEDFIQRLEDVTYITAGDCAACPYLSIEFQANGEDPSTAAARLAETGGNALYNRFRVREEMAKLALMGPQRRGEQSRKKDAKHEKAFMTGEGWDTIRHYGIVIGWEAFTVWVIEPHRPLSKMAQEDQDAKLSKTDVSAMRPTTGFDPASHSEAIRGQNGMHQSRAGSSVDPAWTAQISRRRGLEKRSLEDVLVTSGAEDDAPIVTVVPLMPSTQWRGGTMRKLDKRGYRAASLRDLAQWINSIHHWATTKYADALEAELSAACD